MAVLQGLARYWSPEQIAGRLKREFPDEPEQHIAPQTIYTWIAGQGQEDREHWESFLRRRGKRRRSRRQNTGPDATRSAIADRPAVVEERSRLGDYEGDTVLGPPGTGGGVTLVDRQSRFTIMAKVPCKEARRVHDKIKDRLKPLDKQQRHSVTFDNGTEFNRCHLLENHLDMQVYWAKPGCPYQRGTSAVALPPTYFLSEQIVYPDDPTTCCFAESSSSSSSSSSSGPARQIVTSHSYTFYAGTCQVQQQVTTLRRSDTR